MDLSLIFKEAERRLEPITDHRHTLLFRKQTYEWDYSTNFIYEPSLKHYDALAASIESQLKTHRSYDQLKSYAEARWYNFRTSKGAEWAFCQHPGVIQEENVRSKETDFHIDGTPFDLKLTVLPQCWTPSYANAIGKKAVLDWYYRNQSDCSRYGENNRIILAVHCDDHSAQSWKLKSKLEWIYEKIDKYMLQYEQSNLERLGNEALADLIIAHRKL